MAGFLWPFRTAVDVLWSIVTVTERRLVPQVKTIEEAEELVLELSAAYKPDPWDGRLDYSEHPCRVEYHRWHKTLAKLPGLDCDDVAFFARRAIAKIASDAKVVILIDGTGRYSHAVCQFRLRDGRDGFLDTNGLTWGSDPRKTFGLLYQEARYVDSFVALDMWGIV